jgi:hypothetical protein
MDRTTSQYSVWSSILSASKAKEFQHQKAFSKTKRYAKSFNNQPSNKTIIRMYTEEARRSARSLWKIRHDGCNKHQQSSAGWVARDERPDVKPKTQSCWWGKEKNVRTWTLKTWHKFDSTEIRSRQFTREFFDERERFSWSIVLTLMGIGGFKQRSPFTEKVHFWSLERRRTKFCRIFIFG